MERQLAEIKANFLFLLIKEFRHVLVTKKLEDWPNLSWYQFSDELYNQGIKIELSTQRDWENLFLMEKEKYSIIKKELLKLENLQELREYLNLQ